MEPEVSVPSAVPSTQSLPALLIFLSGIMTVLHATKLLQKIQRLSLSQLRFSLTLSAVATTFLFFVKHSLGKTPPTKL
jgi:uncharacterized membrane protein